MKNSGRAETQIGFRSYCTWKKRIVSWFLQRAGFCRNNFWKKDSNIFFLDLMNTPLGLWTSPVNQSSVLLVLLPGKYRPLDSPIRPALETFMESVIYRNQRSLMEFKVCNVFVDKRLSTIKTIDHKCELSSSYLCIKWFQISVSLHDEMFCSVNLSRHRYLVFHKWKDGISFRLFFGTNERDCELD